MSVSSAFAVTPSGISLDALAGTLRPSRPSAFTGSPNIDLRATGTDPALQTELAQEERDIQDDLDGFKFFPVASISLFSRF